MVCGMIFWINKPMMVQSKLELLKCRLYHCCCCCCQTRNLHVIHVVCLWHFVSNHFQRAKMPVERGILTCFSAMHQVENSRRTKFLSLHFMHWINTKVECDGMECHMRISYKILAKITTVVWLWWQKAIQRIPISLSITFKMCTAQEKKNSYPLLRLDFIATVHWNADETDDNIVALPSLLEFINNL